MSVLPRSDNRQLSCARLSATGVPTSLPETARTCSPSATRTWPTAAGSESPASSRILKAARLSAMATSSGLSEAASLCSQVSITRSGASISGRWNPPCRTATAWSRAASISLAATYYSPFDLPNPEHNRRPGCEPQPAFGPGFRRHYLGARDGHHRVHDVVGVVAVEEDPSVPQFVLQCPLDVVRPHPELLRDTHVEQDDALDRVAVLERDVGGARHVGLVRVASKAYGIDRHVT